MTRAAREAGLSSAAQVEATLQLRALYERQRPGGPMGKWLDAGFSVGIASARFLLRLDGGHRRAGHLPKVLQPLPKPPG